ncbi:hypothetical protein [Burkholderia seminalis]|uniref:hypothetical protein n=1 Tax=Burkholderia TaxID=32008 RepID=UPI00114CC2D8|nr:hypothetical protein [Burkholderia seminalis]
MLDSSHHLNTPAVDARHAAVRWLRAATLPPRLLPPHECGGAAPGSTFAAIGLDIARPYVPF